VAFVVASCKNPSKREENKKMPSKHFWCAKSCMRGNETPKRIVTKFCTGPRRNHLCQLFLSLSLTGFGVAGGGAGHILGFSIDLRRRPYKLSCLLVLTSNWQTSSWSTQCVIIDIHKFMSSP